MRIIGLVQANDFYELIKTFMGIVADADAATPSIDLGRAEAALKDVQLGTTDVSFIPTNTSNFYCLPGRAGGLPTD